MALRPRPHPMLLACGLTLRAAAALAQTDPAVTAATRASLLQQAQQARAANDHARALELATRAGAVEMSAAVRRFVADEQNALGQLGPALGSAEACMRDGEHEGAAARADVTACASLAANLRPRVGRVIIEGTPVAGLRLRVADVEAAPSTWAAGVAVTPGPVLVTGLAPGYRPFHQELDVGPGRTRLVRVVLEEAAQQVELAGAMGGAVSTGEALRAPHEARGPLNPGPIVLFSAGGASFLAAGVFFLVRGSALNASQALCDALGCPPSARADYDRAVTFNTATNAALVTGAALAVGGVIWYLIAPRRSPVAGEPRRAQLFVAPSAGGAVLGVGGAL